MNKESGNNLTRIFSQKIVAGVLAIAAVLVLGWYVSSVTTAAWYSSGGTWDHRVKITIDSAQVDSNLTDFPVYVDLADLPADFHNNVASDGGDIRVTKADGSTELAREVVSIDTASSTGELHFKADSLSSSSDAEFYIYYGNSSASNYATNDTYGAENVWTNGFEAVYHMEEDPNGTAPQIKDSTANSIDGTTNGTVVSASGLLSDGLDFDGTNQDDYIDLGYTSQTLPITTSLWFNTPNPSQDGGFSPKWGNYNNTGDDLYMAIEDPGVYTDTHDAGSVVQKFGSVPANDWTHHVFTVDGSQSISYIDGSQATSTEDTVTTTVDNGLTFRFGARYEGVLDELRVSTTRSADWISAEYVNQNNSTTFYSVGTQETDSSGTTFGDNPDGDWGDLDWQYREKITIDSTQVDSNLTDFPVYVDLADLSSDFHSNVASDGADIRITASDGTTELAREVVSIDTASSTGELHFKADSVSSSSDTEFYIYYGNSSASNYATTDTYGAENVWMGYKYVSHDGGASDSTANNATSSANGGVVAGGATGQLGDATQFDENSQQYFTLSESLAPTSSDMAISYWTNIPADADSDGGADDDILYGQGDVNNGDNRLLNYSVTSFGSGNNSMRVWSSQLGEAVVGNDNRGDGWVHGVVTRSGDSWSFYENNTLVDSSSLSGSLGSAPDGYIGVGIGSSGGLERYFDGTLDEFRVYESARGSDFVSAEYTNQNTPTTFYTTSGQEAETDGTTFGDNPDGDWGDLDWTYREKITISASEVDSDLTDFPVYVDLSDLSSDFHSNVASDGADIRMTKGDGTTELAREVVSIDTASSTGELHFKADSISSSSDTEFYIYYGNGSAINYAPYETYGRDAVWSNYEAVYHMNEDPSGGSGAIVDSTGNSYDASANGSMTSGDLVASTIGQGLDFDGADDYLSISTLSLSGDWTVSSWLNVVENNASMALAGESNSYDSLKIEQYNNTGNVGVTAGGSNLDYGYSTPYGAQSHLVWRNDDSANENDILHNGSGAGNTLSSSVAMDIAEIANANVAGTGGSNSDWIDGVIDELRLSLSKLSADWISAEYTNQNTPTTFYTTGGQETQGPTTITSIIKQDGTGDYTSISAWESATDGDLVADNEIHVGQIADTATYDEQVTIAGATTSATNYRKLTVDPSVRHDGTAGSGPVVNPSTDGHVFTVDEGYFQAEWLEVTGWTGQSSEAFRVNGDEFTLGHSIMHESGGHDRDGVYLGTSGITAHIHNSIFYNIGRAAVHIQGEQNVTVNVTNVTGYNLTSYGSDQSIYDSRYGGFGFDTDSSMDNSGSVMVLQNVTSNSQYEDFRVGSQGGSFSGSGYNASSDTTAPGSNSLTSVTQSDQFVSITDGSEDLHLKDGASLIDAGTSLGSDFQTDIDGETRSSSWDIGSDQFVASGGSSESGVIEIRSGEFRGGIEFR